ncbi:unnamed protein product [Darwinula stevensoni]|uniref:Corticotropin-releasing factor binding protein N-terminal domain-containing protein n=1 Tax=Darwinula stevensoni TaxID=69355 RepID=A0A7R9ACP4_9CRUS|nr:unnamed protein product [Darwinula stevensoni]CAG0900200.1 unnamed protein product [Darwinula stevensoni]
MVTQEGVFELRSHGSATCALYVVLGSQQSVVIHLEYVYAPCHQGNLVNMIDGWEMDGEYFPSVAEHGTPMSDRVLAVCGERAREETLLAGQNAGQVSYRLPSEDARVVVRVLALREPDPCNVLVLGGEGELVGIGNGGKRRNCTVVTLFPATFLLSLVKAGPMKAGPGEHLPLSHKCGSGDRIEVRGSSGLESESLLFASVCGLIMNPEEGLPVEVPCPMSSFFFDVVGLVTGEKREPTAVDPVTTTKLRRILRLPPDGADAARRRVEFRPEDSVRPRSPKVKVKGRRGVPASRRRRDDAK